ncbi:MAG: hypothetical protein IKI56_01475 [Ruminococcus sp.]|nr:hypothetical protein [Ruminococcus sp.]
MKKIISLSAALIMVSAFAAGCGKNSSSSSSEKEKSKFEGKWQCTGITEGNDVMTDIMGTDASALFQIELFDENKGKFFSFIFGESEEPEDIKWEETEENKIQLSGGSLDDLTEPFVFEYKDDQLIIDMSDEEDEQQTYATLVKVDEFTPYSDDSEAAFDISE